MSITVGSVCVAVRVADRTNLRIHITHTPSNRIVVERADIPDLVKALVATLGPEFIWEHGQVHLVADANEQIARYIEGDGTDAQRVALADGIRTEKYADTCHNE